MATTSSRQVALAALGAALVVDVPDLAGHVEIGWPDPEVKLARPSLIIDPSRMRYVPDQPALWSEIDAVKYIDRVGYDTGTVQLRLVCKDKVQREALEQKLIDALRRDLARPGGTVLTLPNYHGARVAVWLEGSDWDDAPAFAKERDSVLEVSVRIPALVVRDGEKLGIYTIDTLRLSTKHVAGEIDPDDTEPDQTVLVNDDGTVSPDA